MSTEFERIAGVTNRAIWSLVSTEHLTDIVKPAFLSRYAGAVAMFDVVEIVAEADASPTFAHAVVAGYTENSITLKILSSVEPEHRMRIVAGDLELSMAGDFIRPADSAKFPVAFKALADAITRYAPTSATATLDKIKAALRSGDLSAFSQAFDEFERLPLQTRRAIATGYRTDHITAAPTDASRRTSRAAAAA